MIIGPPVALRRGRRALGRRRRCREHDEVDVASVAGHTPERDAIGQRADDEGLGAPKPSRTLTAEVMPPFETTRRRRSRVAPAPRRAPSRSACRSQGRAVRAAVASGRHGREPVRGSLERRCTAAAIAARARRYSAAASTSTSAAGWRGPAPRAGASSSGHASRRSRAGRAPASAAGPVALVPAATPTNAGAQRTIELDAARARRATPAAITARSAASARPDARRRAPARPRALRAAATASRPRGRAQLAQVQLATGGGVKVRARALGRPVQQARARISEDAIARRTRSRRSGRGRRAPSQCTPSSVTRPAAGSAGTSSSGASRPAKAASRTARYSGSR